MTDVTTPQGDGWQFHADRTVTLWLSGKPYRCRSPRMGEFRRIRAEALAVPTVFAKALADASAHQEEITAAVEAKTMTLEEGKAEVAEMSADLEALVESTHWGLLRDAISLLCSTPLPPEDDLPPWLVCKASKGLGDLCGHWQQIPPRHGAPAPAE